MEKEYTLDKDFEIRIKLLEEDSCYLASLVINNGEKLEDKLIFSDSQNDGEEFFTFKLYRVGKYIAFRNHDNTELGYNHLYIIDKSGKLYKDIFELNHSGTKVLIKSFTFKENAIVIYAMSMLQNENVSLGATYTYQIDSSGNIDFDNPLIQ